MNCEEAFLFEEQGNRFLRRLGRGSHRPRSRSLHRLSSSRATIEMKRGVSWDESKPEAWKEQRKGKEGCENRGCEVEKGRSGRLRGP